MTSNKRQITLCGASLMAGVLLAGVWSGLDHALLAPGSTANAQPTLATSSRSLDSPKGGSTAPVALTPEELANIRVYEVANASVVNITTSTVSYQSPFGVPVEGEGSGSGSVIDKQGHILTNNHVVEGANEIQVTFSDGETYPAELVGADEIYDMAVLRVEAPAEKLRPIALGSSDGLRVGQKAYALGNPFGLEQTLTTGIVSSLNRSLPSRSGNGVMTNMIQTDAAMNPGNSGGPLLDSRAQMIGMNVAIASRTGQNAGVGFAIPVDRVRRFVPELIQNGRVEHAYHGIVMLNQTSKGLRIARVSEGGPAAKAGLQGFGVKQIRRRQGPFIYTEEVEDRSQADYILAIDGEPIESHTDFAEIMDRYRPGDTVTFTIKRQGKSQEVPLRLGAA